MVALNEPDDLAILPTPLNASLSRNGEIGNGRRQGDDDNLLHCPYIPFGLNSRSAMKFNLAHTNCYYDATSSSFRLQLIKMNTNSGENSNSGFSEPSSTLMATGITITMAAAVPQPQPQPQPQQNNFFQFESCL